MKFKGKIALWFWFLFIAVNLMLLYELVFTGDNLIPLMIGGIIFNLVFLPIIIRNYIYLTYDSVTICFGYGKYSINVNDIAEVYSTHNPLASSAASLDRIVIKGKRDEIICSVKKNTILGRTKKVKWQYCFPLRVNK